MIPEHDADIHDHPELMQAFAGFELAGWRETNGVIRIGSMYRHLYFIKAWPKSLYLFGNTYELEDIVKGSVDPKTGAVFENAQYC